MKSSEQITNDLANADKPSMSSTGSMNGIISFDGQKQGEMKAFTKNLEVQMSPELQQ